MNAPKRTRRWASPKDTAAYLGVHIQTVYRWIDTSRVRASRIGRAVRVDLYDLDHQLDARANDVATQIGTFVRSRRYSKPRLNVGAE